MATSLSAEEVEKTLADSIASIQKSFDTERQLYKDKISKLEATIKEKDEQMQDLNEKFMSKRKKDDVNKKVMEHLNQEKELIQKELEMKITEYKTALIELSTLNNQIEFDKQKIMQLELEKKNLNKKLEESIKAQEETEKKCDAIQNQCFLIQKKVDMNNQENLKFQGIIEEKNKKIDELNNHINELNEKIKQYEDNNNNLLNYIKEVKENEDKLNKEREQIKIEREQYNSFKEEINKKKDEEIKKLELEKLMKKEEEKEIKEEKKENSLEEQEKMIIDLLCEFLLKLNNLQYYISLFDLLDKSLKQYDELKFINNLNSSSHESMNDILFNFYESLNSYFSVQQENATLNDFLLQKTFRLHDVSKEEVEIIKKINSIKFNQEANILDIYRKKRELFFKSIELTFNVLKDKILGEKKKINNNSNISINKNEFFKITKPPLELEINFDEILNIDYTLVKYQVYNVFRKLRELTIHISDIPLFLIYSLIVNCHNLNNLKIVFIRDKSEQKYNSNIEKLNEICPIIINYLKQLNTFSLINVSLSSNKLSLFVESLKNSKIKKLTLRNCFQKKEDINLIIPYFSQNILSEIDLSNHNFHIPSILNNTLLNYNLNNKLTSIIFNDCQLNEDDIKSITNYIVSSTSLLVCDIGKNILSPKSCSTFGYCILKTTSLETLRINECGINGESLLFIFNGKGSKPLKHVNINGNEFGDIGLVSISAFMKNSPLLESIELEKCGGTDMGFISLANMIQSNTNSKIKYVNFHKNNVTQASLGILKKFNDVFTSRKVVFALDKMEGQSDKIDVDCAIFT